MRFRRPSCLLAAFAILCCAAGALCQPSFAQSTDEGAIDERPEPFVPLRPRAEPQEDRLRALSLYAAGRAAFQKEDFPAALRLYARSLRWDPSADRVRREMAPLAFSLHKPALGVRYALADLERSEIAADQLDLLRRLAEHLTGQGDWERAARLLEKGAKVLDAAPPSGERVITWFELGRLHYLNRDFALAAGRLKQVAQALEEPERFALDEANRQIVLREPPLTYQLFGECFLEAGDAAAAAQAFEKAEAAKSNPPLASFNQARIAAAQEKPQEVLAALDRYFSAHTSSEGLAPYELLAATLKRLGREAELLDWLARLAAADPGNTPLHYYLASQLKSAGRAEEAAAAFSDLIAPGAQRPPSEAFESLAQLGLERKNPAWLFTAASAAAARSLSLAALDDAIAELVKQPESLHAFLELARAKRGAEPPLLDFGGRIAAALVAGKAQQFDEARVFWEAALAAEPARAAEVISAWGIDLLKADQFARAAEVFQQGIDRNLPTNDNPVFHFYLAGALEMAGRTEEALSAAKTVAARATDAPRLAARMAWILTHAKRYAEARAAYLELLEKVDARPETEEIRDVARECRLALSGLAVHLEDLPEAEEFLEQVLDEFPDDPGAQNDLGYLWADANKHLAKAQAMIDVAVAAEPNNKAYRDSLGWVYFRQSRFAEAVTQLRDAADQKEADGVVLDHLGDALAATGERAEAAGVWERAVQAFMRDGQQDKIPSVSAKIKNAGAP